MGLDTFLVGFAFAAGAASFFSPCSIGLLPAYIGYFLGAEERKRQPAPPLVQPSAADPPADPPRDLAGGVFRGAGFGLVASAGFFLLFLATGILVALIGTSFLGPYLVWVSRAIGLAIIVMGLLLLAGKSFTLSPRITVSPTKSLSSMFLFGVAYALASLGCTLPIFLSVVLGSFVASSPWVGVLALVAYAAGMAILMVVVSALLGASRETAAQFLRRAVQPIRVGSALLMIGAGSYVLYYYTVVIA